VNDELKKIFYNGVEFIQDDIMGAIAQFLSHGAQDYIDNNDNFEQVVNIMN